MVLTVRNWIAGVIYRYFFYIRRLSFRIFTVQNRQKLQTDNSKAQSKQQSETEFASSNCFQRSPLKFKFPIPTPHPSPSSSPSRCSSPCCSSPPFIHFHLLLIYVHCCNPLYNWLCSILQSSWTVDRRLQSRCNHDLLALSS